MYSFLPEGLQTGILAGIVWTGITEKVIKQEASQRFLYEFTVGRMEDKTISTIQRKVATF